MITSAQNEGGEPENLTSSLESIDPNGQWYEGKKITLSPKNWWSQEDETLVKITSKETNYQFVWENNNKTVPLSDSFTLPGEDALSMPLYSNVVPDETAIPEGAVFQGWTLGANDTHIHWGNESISRRELREAMEAGNLTVEYPLTADEAVKIPLTPKYVAADLADTIPYSVKVYLGSENTEPIESFEYRGIAGPAIEEGAYIERPEIKAVIDQYQDEYPEKEIIGIESLSNTDNVVKIILKKEYVQIHTLVEEEGSVSHGNYQYGSDTFDNKDLMVRSGDTIRLKIVPDEGYTIGQLFIGGTPQTIDRSKIDEDGNYEIEYTVSETATIWTSFAADINGNGEPDETETTYSITYAAGTAGTNAQNMPQNKTDILSGTTQTISAAVPTWTGYVFTGWTSTDVTETAGSFTMPEKNVTFTATWKEDANGDGEPDDTETKYSITYSDGEAKGAAQGMPAKAENILSGTTQTISTAVPTWTGYVFAGWTSNEVQATSGSFIMPEANVTFTATWKEDANGDGEPDDAETKYSITYSDGEAKGAAQGMPAKAENILSGTTQTISAAVPTWTGHVFTGWTSTDVTETAGNFTMPEKDVTFTAAWKVDANGNGEPDENEQKYSISYSDGEAKGAAQGMPAKAENILSGTTQTISAAVPTWAGHVFTGWTSTDVTETAGNFTMPEKDVTFTALWKEYGSGGSKEDDDDDDASEENGSGSSRKPIEAQKGQVVNAAGKTGEWVLEGNQFTEQNGYIPSREYLKIDGNIYGFYSRGYAIGSEHGHYYTSEAIAAAGGYRDAQGAWNLNGWWIRYSDGTYPHGQWEYLTYNGRSDWYYFDEDGWMEDGWFQWEDHWYYLHTEYDGFRGHMYTGWHEIGGKWYYFRTDQDGGTPGAMMTDARTPDGFYVGEDGAWIQ